MSTHDLVARVQTWAKEQPWRLYGSQIGVLVRNEVRRNLFRRLWVHLLAAIPVLILLAHNIFNRSSTDVTYIENDTQVLAEIIQLYYVRLGIFFACMGIFTWLFRGRAFVCF